MTPQDNFCELREQLSSRIEYHLDNATRLIAALDNMDGCPDLEDCADAEPSLGWGNATGQSGVGTLAWDEDGIA